MFSVFCNGLYWGLFAGILVGLAAIAVGAGRTTTATLVPKDA